MQELFNWTGVLKFYLKILFEITYKSEVLIFES